MHIHSHFTETIIQAFTLEISDEELLRSIE